MVRYARLRPLVLLGLLPLLLVASEPKPAPVAAGASVPDGERFHCTFGRALIPVTHSYPNYTFEPPTEATGAAVAEAVRRSTATTKAVCLIPLPTIHTPYRISDERFGGFAVALVNNTAAPITVTTTDNYLPLDIEAKNANGQWVPIAIRPFSGCGLSYSDLTLAPGEHRFAVAPFFKGNVVTQIRFRLYAADGTVVVSPAYTEYIDPIQLTLISPMAAPVWSPWRIIKNAFRDALAGGMV